MSEFAISCKGIKKVFQNEYSKVEALKGVDLDINSGEIFMLVGPSGSGKTTLISIIAGILNQTEGQCLLYGKDLNNMQQPAKTIYRGKNVGFVFQAFNLIPMLNCEENVAIPLIINGIDKKEAIEQAQKVLKDLNMEDKIKAYPHHLSGGQQQRVAIARSYIHSPKIIVCDEPTSSLDAETGRSVLKILKEKVLTKDRSIIIVTHDSRIFEYGDKIAKIDDGKIISIESNHHNLV